LENTESTDVADDFLESYRVQTHYLEDQIEQWLLNKELQ
jgi:hypothetical protein